MKNIIFVAPPAAGKGTQSKLISMEYNIPHISTGDLLRNEVEMGTNLGKIIKSEMDSGNLVSDDIIVNLLRKRISQVDCNNGYILDGYPRNLEQAITYENLLRDLSIDIGTVIFLDIDMELALNRTISRKVCSVCGSSFNTTDPSLSPKIDGICDKCGHLLIVRSDDNKETFINRFNTYVKSTQPLIDYYKNKGILKTIKILENDRVNDILDKIKATIN